MYACIYSRVFFLLQFRPTFAGSLERSLSGSSTSPNLCTCMNKVMHVYGMFVNTTVWVLSECTITSVGGEKSSKILWDVCVSQSLPHLNILLQHDIYDMVQSHKKTHTWSCTHMHKHTCTSTHTCTNTHRHQQQSHADQTLSHATLEKERNFLQFLI